MEEGLKIRIGADVSGLEQGVNQAQQALRRVAPATTQAQFALTNLSRVAQDAPFGFIAIQNNIDPLIQSFGQLKQSAGGTVPALKTLAASLAGPAGIALGLAAVTSLVTGVIQKYGSLSAAVNELAASNDKAAVRQRELNSELIKTISGQTGEINTINNLVKILNDADNSQQVRIGAYKRLKDEFPGVIQNLTQENALTGQGAEILAFRSQQLVNYIKLKAKEGALIKLGEQAAEAELKAAKEGVDVIQNQNTVLNRLINTVLGGGDAFRGLAGRINSASKDLKSASSDSLAYADALAEVQKQIAGVDRDLFKFKVPAPGNAAGSKQIVESVQNALRLVRANQLSADDVIGGQFGAENSIQIPITIPGVPTSVIESFRKFGEVRKNALDLENFKKQVAEFRQLLQIGLAQPLGDLIFNFLDQGKIGFKEFADAAIASIKRIVAQLIATKLIQLVGNILAPGAGSLLGGLFSAGGFGPSANLSGLGSGGLQLFGQVALAARGTDLVGVISQSNARIGRVG